MEKGLTIGITVAVFLVLLGLAFVAYGNGGKATDYSKPEHWLSVPAAIDKAAGHSQGSNVMAYLLSEYMKEHPEVYERMVAAYVIGYSITDEYPAENPHLKFAEGSDDTGVIISYNTESPDVVEGTDPVVLPGAIAINPITWTRGEEPATAEESLGAFMPNAEGIYVRTNNFADARVDKAKGAVICSTANVSELSPGNPVFGRGVFYIYDYQFYYYDIRENAANRARRFLQK